jgi:DNA-binding transcriptional ArsR family regulator
MLPESDYTRLRWEMGTGYDLFISLLVLHRPELHGLRASWAAGVRSRLPTEERETLETAITLMYEPLPFVHTVPMPKDTQAVLDALDQLPGSKRLEALSLHYSTPSVVREVLLSTTSQRKWTTTEKSIISNNIRNRDRLVTPTYLNLLYETWAHRDEFGDKYLKALKAYVEAFFKEEEQRILPVLRRGLSHAQMRAGSLQLPTMLEELSAGVRLPELDKARRIYLAPSFWGAPFLFWNRLDVDTLLIVFGARPDNMALIPGEVIPDSLLLSLKALSDPTRLRILRTLVQSPQTAAQLSRQLRLRPPTVTHHLLELRLPGMVHITVSPEADRSYTTRYEGLAATQDLRTRLIQGA